MPRLKPKSALPPAHSRYRLAQEIVARSEADNWDAAKLEWSLDFVFYAEEDHPGRCLCGHHPIIESCVIVNRLNGNEVVVGNVCVKRFLGLPSDKLFAGIGRIAADPTRALNAETIDYSFRKEWVNDWERTFYLDTFRKRKLSYRQRDKREQINLNILTAMQREQSA